MQNPIFTAIETISSGRICNVLFQESGKVTNLNEHGSKPRYCQEHQISALQSEHNVTRSSTQPWVMLQGSVLEPVLPGCSF
jgi:hypothetical protein